jgi:hypothetical protein
MILKAEVLDNLNTNVVLKAGVGAPANFLVSVKG